MQSLAMLLLAAVVQVSHPAAQRFVGGVTAGEAYASISVTLGTADDSVQIQAIGFGFLGLGPVPSKRLRTSGDSVVLQLTDWQGVVHHLAGQVTGAGVEGDYWSPDRRGRFYLRRVEGEAPAGLSTQIAGVYRTAAGGAVSIRHSGDDLLVTAFDDGTTRRAVWRGDGRFGFGPRVDDWSEWVGEVRVADERTEPVLTLTRLGQGGRSITTALSRAALQEEEVGFANGDVHLAGTLIKPITGERLPAIIFAQGSGGATREADRVLAQFFASEGLAALIFDKRGTGESSGDWRVATRQDLAQDIVAGVRYLRARPDIRARSVGLHGTSNGGWVAPTAAAMDPDVAFVITVSAPGLPSDGQELYRRTLNMTGMGYVPNQALPDSALEEGRRALEAFFAWVKDGADGPEVARLIHDSKGKAWFPYAELPDTLDPGHPPDFVAGFRSNMHFDVDRVWRGFRAPVLLFYGATDPFVPAAESFRVMSDVVAYHPGSQLVLFDEADHWMYRRDPAHPRYPTPGFVPEYLSLLRLWLQQHVITASSR